MPSIMAFKCWESASACSFSLAKAKRDREMGWGFSRERLFGCPGLLRFRRWAGTRLAWLSNASFSMVLPIVLTFPSFPRCIPCRLTRQSFALRQITGLASLRLLLGKTFTEHSFTLKNQEK